jgi:hypothetical protein
MPASRHQHRPPGEVGRGRLGKGHHRADQERAGQHLGVQEKHRRRDVGAVREADRERRRQAVGLPRRAHEGREVRGPAAQIRLVEHALGQPAEEARHAVLQHRPAGREQRGTGGEHPAEGQEVGLVAAGAVQQQERRPVRRAGGLEAMDEGLDAHGVAFSLVAFSRKRTRASRSPGSPIVCSGILVPGV